MASLQFAISCLTGFSSKLGYGEMPQREMPEVRSF